LRMAGLDYGVLMLPEEHPLTGCRLQFLIRPASLRKRIVLPLLRAPIRSRLERAGNALYLAALLDRSEGDVPSGFSPGCLDWAAARFPALRRSLHREAELVGEFTRRFRRFYRLRNDPAHRSRPDHRCIILRDRDHSDYRRTLCDQRRYRRVLIVPMMVQVRELRQYLAPPLHASAPRAPGQSGASIRIPIDAESIPLYCQIYLDAGCGESNRKTKAKQSHQELAFSEPGAEEFLAVTLLAGVRLMTDHETINGWQTLFSTNIPLLRPQLPGDRHTASYRMLRRSIRFALGDEHRKVLGEVLARPLRGINHTDSFPEILYSTDTLIYQDGESLDLEIISVERRVALNRVYRLSRQIRSGAPTLETWLSHRLGCTLHTMPYAWLASYMDIEHGARRMIALRDCQYRFQPAMPLPAPV
ncbi:MAG: hypothetical protein KDK34_09555, partial [Leptospiraceae bacterium]|nr:hypothetical protein [Leptospiraceae bacterium]